MTIEGLLTGKGDGGKPIAEGKQIRVDAGETLAPDRPATTTAAESDEEKTEESN